MRPIYKIGWAYNIVWIYKIWVCMFSVSTSFDRKIGDIFLQMARTCSRGESAVISVCSNKYIYIKCLELEVTDFAFWFNY